MDSKIDRDLRRASDTDMVARNADPRLTPFVLLAITFIAFGWATVLSTQRLFAPELNATALNSDSFHALIGWEIFFGALCLIVLRSQRFPLAALWPQPSLHGLYVGVGLYFLSFFAMLLCALPFALLYPGNPLTDAVTAAEIDATTLVLLSVVNGLYEEILLLGVIQRSLHHHGAAVAVGVTILLRVLYHAYQGVAAEAGMIGFGVVLGIFFFRTKWLFPVVLAHVLADLLPLLWMTY